jgi:hypothetical protein
MNYGQPGDKSKSIMNAYIHCGARTIRIIRTWGMCTLIATSLHTHALRHSSDRGRNPAPVEVCLQWWHHCRVRDTQRCSIDRRFWELTRAGAGIAEYEFPYRLSRREDQLSPYIISSQCYHKCAIGILQMILAAIRELVSTNTEGQVFDKDFSKLAN